MTPTFYSSVPNPKDDPNSTHSPPTPPTPDNSIPKLLPGVLTPNRSPDIGMSPVIHLYHNMAALKSTVIQSYLDDHKANTTRLNALNTTESTLVPAKRSPDKLTSPQRPFNMWRKTNYSDQQAGGRRSATSRGLSNGTLNRSSLSVVSPNSDLTKSSPSRAVTPPRELNTTSIGKISHSNRHHTSYSNDILNQKHPQGLGSPQNSLGSSLSDVTAAVVSPNSDLTKSSPGQTLSVTPPRALHTTPIWKTSHANWHPNGYSNDIFNLEHSQSLGSPRTSGNSGSGLNGNSVRGTDLFMDSSWSDSASYLWDYGIQLDNSPKTNTDMVHVSTNKSLSPSFVKRPQKQSQHLITSPSKLASLTPSPQANPCHHNSIIKTTPDHPSQKLNSKSVSFLISSPDRDNDPRPDLKTIPFPLAPHVRVSLNNQRSVPHPDLKPNSDSKQVCAIIKPTPEPKGSPTQLTGSQPPTHKERARVQFSDEALGPSATAQENRDANMKCIDESQAYTTYTSKGHFTPRPGNNENKTKLILGEVLW